MLIPAPYSSNTLATSTCPALAASIRGVCPFSLWSSMLAPAFSSTFTTSTKPPAQAYVRAVFPAEERMHESPFHHPLLTWGRRSVLAAHNKPKHITSSSFQPHSNATPAHHSRLGKKTQITVTWKFSCRASITNQDFFSLDVRFPTSACKIRPNKHRQKDERVIFTVELGVWFFVLSFFF